MTRFAEDREQGGRIRPESILIACVAENREPYSVEAYRLFRSLIKLGGRLARAKKIAYFVGEVDPQVSARLGELGVIVKIVETVDKRCPHANKLAMLENFEETHEVLLMLDCDVVITRDFLDVLSPDCVMAKPVDGDPLKMKDWKKLFHLFGIEFPKERFRTTWDYKETIPYFNSGVISVPAKYAKVLLGAWKNKIDRLFDLYPAHPEFAAHRFFTDQFAFALSLQMEKIPYKAFPLEMNTPIHAPINPSFKPESLEPYIIHHHHLFDEKGISQSSYPNINKFIDAVNAATIDHRPERKSDCQNSEKKFDNGEFRDEKPKSDLDPGSGNGSRTGLLCQIIDTIWGRFVKFRRGR